MAGSGVDHNSGYPSNRPRHLSAQQTDSIGVASDHPTATLGFGRIYDQGRGVDCLEGGEKLHACGGLDVFQRSRDQMGDAV